MLGRSELLGPGNFDAPLALVSWSWQPPEPMVPSSDSGLMLPVVVIGRSLEMRPNEV